MGVGTLTKCGRCDRLYDERVVHDCPRCANPVLDD